MRSPSSSSSSKRQARAAGGDQYGGCPGKKAGACDINVGVKRGPWTAEEDEILADYIRREGEGRWPTLPNKAGLRRCGKSCRLRWMNYLRPSVKRGHITPDEEDLILRLHRLLGNRWSLIAGRIPGRTDNEIKNYWNTHLSKKLMSQGIDPKTHRPIINNHHSTDNTADKQYNDPKNGINDMHVQHGDAGIMSNGCCRFAHHKKDDIKQENNLRNSDDQKVKKNIANEDHNMIDNCSSDDAFSSFLNFLINDDMFDDIQYQNRGQEGQPDDQQSSCQI